MSYIHKLQLFNLSSITPEEIDSGLNYALSCVRRKAIIHKNSSEENLIKALKDKDFIVTFHALNHYNTTHNVINEGLNTILSTRKLILEKILNGR